MSPPSPIVLQAAIADFGHGRAPAGTVSELAGHGLALLPLLEQELVRDLPMDVLERLERLLKAVLREQMRGGIRGPEARAIAASQQRTGFLLKYKSYTVKLSHPFGYSLFLHEPGLGFSFQRHLEDKLELFHILAPHRGGYVFVAEHEEWHAVYQAEAFRVWLAGGADPRYDRFRIEPRPGDAIAIDRLNVVHSVIGCVLEEFATSSTDMVDRLHDQNAGKAIPGHFQRARVREALAKLVPPRASRRITMRPGAASAEPIPSEPIRGGSRIVLGQGAFDAVRYRIEPGGRTDLVALGERVASVYCFSGRGRLLLVAPDELASEPLPGLAIGPGDLLTIARGMHLAFVAEGPEPLELTLHGLPFEVALPATSA